MVPVGTGRLSWGEWGYWTVIGILLTTVGMSLQGYPVAALSAAPPPPLPLATAMVMAILVVVVTVSRGVLGR